MADYTYGSNDNLLGQSGARLFYGNSWTEYMAHPMCANGFADDDDPRACKAATRILITLNGGRLKEKIPGRVWWGNGTGDDAFPPELRKYCFECAFWLERLVCNEGTVRVLDPDGNLRQYMFDVLNPLLSRKSAGMRGFGGRLWHIHFFDDNAVVDTNNLWYNGVIPKWLEHHFEPNAEFV